MSWFDVADGRLRFRGRVTKQPIVEWLASEDGRRALEAAVRRTGFSLFGRARAAKRRMTGELWHALSSQSVREMIGGECERYVAASAELAYAPALPRLTVSLHRLVVIPRAMVLGRAGPRVMVRAAACSGMADVEETFAQFFSRWILAGMNEAIQRARPSPRRPVHARESWALVAVDDGFVWVDPLWSGPGWRGHVVMYEMPSPQLDRRQRRALDAAIGELTRSLPNLSRLQRDSTVRLAVDQMDSLTIRAW